MKTSDTKQQCVLVEKLLGPGSPEEVMVNRFHISLKRSDLWLLHDEQLLNKKVILPFCKADLINPLCILQIVYCLRGIHLQHNDSKM